MSLIILYQNLAEQNEFDKAKFLSNSLSIRGEFRNEVDLFSPIITVQLEISKAINYNYCYITDVNRFYYISNIVLNNSNTTVALVDLYLTEDTLMSFKNQLFQLSGIVTRSSNPDDNTKYLIDKKLPCEASPLWETIQSSGALVSVLNRNSYSYVLTLACAPSETGLVTTTEEAWAQSPTVSQTYSMSYLLSYKQIAKFSDKLFGKNLKIDDVFSGIFNDVSQALVGLVVFPFDIALTNSGDSFKFGATFNGNTNQRIYYGNTSINMEENIRIIYDSKYITLTVGTLQIPPKYSNFLDFSPYTVVQIYLPFYGYLEVDTNLVIGKTLNFIYTIDFITGSGTIRIYEGADYLQTRTKPLYSVECQVGIQINLSASNVSERLQNGAKLAIKTIGNIISMGTASAMTELDTPRMLTPKTGKVTKKYAKWAAKNELEERGRMSSFISDTTSDVVSLMHSNIISGQSGNGVTEWDILAINEGRTGFCMNIFARVKRVKSIELPEYAYLVGYPTYSYKQLGELSRYNEIGDICLDGISGVTEDERDDIYNRLRSGFRMNRVVASSFVIRPYNNYPDNISYSLSNIQYYDDVKAEWFNLNDIIGIKIGKPCSPSRIKLILRLVTRGDLTEVILRDVFVDYGICTVESGIGSYISTLYTTEIIIDGLSITSPDFALDHLTFFISADIKQ